jgi:hypothetical protein
VHRHRAETVVSVFPQQPDTPVHAQQATQEATVNKTLTNALQVRASIMAFAYKLHQDRIYAAVGPSSQA